MNVRLVCLFIVGLSMRPLFADYIPPTFQEIAEGTTAIVDATVERLNENGHPVLKIHGYFKGRKASNTMTGIFLACKGGLPSNRMKPTQRYVICLWKDLLFEYQTAYTVRKGLGGEPELLYQDAQTLTSETLTFTEFRRRLAKARKQAVVKELVEVASLASPLRWLADGSFDPGERAVRGWFDVKRFPLGELSAPWTVPKLLETHRKTMKHAEENPSDDYDEYLRRCRPIHVLAQTRDIRAMIAIGETLSSPVKHLPMTAAAILRGTFGIEPEEGHKTLVAGAQHWWKNHEEELRNEVQRLGKSEPQASKQ